MSEIKESRSWTKILSEWLVAEIVVFLAIGVMALVFLLMPEKPEEVTDAVPALLSVRVERLALSPVPQTTEIHGFLRPHRSVDLVMEETGRVVAKPNEAGAHVASGELVVALETNLIGAELAQAEANLERAERALDLTREQFERAESLIESRAVSQDEVDIKRSAYTVAVANVASQRANLELYRVRFDRHHISVPFAGVVSDLDVELGSHVMTGQMIGRLDDVTALEIDLMVAPEVRETLHLGDAVEVWLDVRPDEIHRGVISRLDAVADSVARKFEVEVTVDNSDRALLAGAPVRCRLTVSEPREALIIPQEWTTRVFSSRCVFVVTHSEDGNAHVDLTEISTRPVRQLPGMIEITSGLPVTAEIVIERLTDLTDGQEVDLFTGEVVTAEAVASEPVTDEALVGGGE